MFINKKETKKYLIECNLFELEQYCQNEEYKQLPNFWKYVAKNKNLNTLFIDKFKEELTNYFYHIQCECTCEYIHENEYYNWDYNKLSYCITNLNIDFLNYYIEKNWDYSVISRRIDINEIKEDLYQHHHNPVYQSKPWDWSEVSKNPTLTYEFLQSNYCKNKKWNNYFVSKNENIPLDKLILYSNVCFKGISERNDLNEDFILTYKNRDWNMYELSKRCRIDFIDEYINEFKWDFEAISYNKYLTNEFIKKYIRKNWEYENIICNLIDIYFDLTTSIDDKNYIKNIIQNPEIIDITILKINEYQQKYVEYYYQIIKK